MGAAEGGQTLRNQRIMRGKAKRRCAGKMSVDEACQDMLVIGASQPVSLRHDGIDRRTQLPALMFCCNCRPMSGWRRLTPRMPQLLVPQRRIGGVIARQAKRTVRQEAGRRRGQIAHRTGGENEQIDRCRRFLAQSPIEYKAVDQSTQLQRNRIATAMRRALHRCGVVEQVNAAIAVRSSVDRAIFRSANRK
jgi:hypothetical protein